MKLLKLFSRIFPAALIAAALLSFSLFLPSSGIYAAGMVSFEYPDGADTSGVKSVFVNGTELSSSAVFSASSFSVAAQSGDSIQLSCGGHDYIYFVTGGASYVRAAHYDDLFSAVGTAVRTAGSAGLRFRFAFPDAAVSGNSAYSVSEIGILTKRSSNTAKLLYTPDTVSELGIAKSTSFSKTAEQNVLLSDNGKTSVISAVIMNMTVGEYGIGYNARPYMRVQYSGMTFCVYGTAVSSSVRSISKAALSDPAGGLSSSETAVLTEFSDTVLSVSVASAAELNKTADKSDSHLSTISCASLEVNFREAEIQSGSDSANALISGVAYPRIKCLSDGSYLLFFQYGQISHTTYVAYSTDGIHFSNRKTLFALNSAAVRDDGVTDSLRYATTDAIELQNGDIIAVCSWRYNTGYTLAAKYCGITMRRSTDKGKTWSAAEIIYTGRNWEPYLLQLESGEIQLYFTATAVKFQLDPDIVKSGINSSSGVGLIRSYDNGVTWTPGVTAEAYGKSGTMPSAMAQIVMQQYVTTSDSGTRQYTDQMASAVCLNNGTIALVTESRVLTSAAYKLSISYSADNWAKSLGINEVGPQARTSNFRNGGAPYIVQFPSGETVVSYNTSSLFYTLLGDSSAKNFAAPQQMFANEYTGFWGSIAVDSSHSLLCVFPDMNGEAGNWSNNLCICRAYLNHRITAKATSVRVDGDTSEWSDNTDALFIGSESQAQVSLRAAYSDTGIYFAADRLDSNLLSGDALTLYIRSGSDTYMITVDIYGSIKSFTKNGSFSDTAGIICSAAAGTDGACLEIRIPRVSLGSPSGSVSVFPVLINDDGADLISDSLYGLSLSSPSGWIPVYFD